MASDSLLEQRIAARMAALDDARLVRTLAPPRGIDFTSNDYLALSRHPLLAAGMIEGIRREGCGSTGSRMLTGERDAFARLEHSFATFKGTERARYFSSGYLASLAVMTAFAETGDLIVSDERNHASLIDGIRLSAASRAIFPHNDVGALARLLAAPRTGQVFVVVESLFSMDGDLAPLAEYASLCRSTGAALVVDEAHAVGVYGSRGSGLVEARQVERDVFVSINSAGKALGVSGAFVAGSANAIEYLTQRARPFVFSTAAPPAVADALEASLSIVTAEPGRRQRLGHLARYLRDRLRGAGFDVAPGDSHIIPVIIGANDRAVVVAGTTQAQGFDVRAIRPPSIPEGTARVRLTVNVRLDEPILDRLVTTLAAAMKESTSGLPAPTRPSPRAMGPMARRIQ